jgi:hypothetical protein
MSLNWRAGFEPVRQFLFRGLGRFEKAAWIAGLIFAGLSMLVANFVPGEKLPIQTLRTIAGWLSSFSTWSQVGLLGLAGAAFAIRVFASRNPAERPMSAFARGRLERFLSRVEDVRQGLRAPMYTRIAQGSGDIESLSRLNAAAFSVSMTYSADFQSKVDRNGPLLAKAPEAFVFVRAGDRDLGFSSIVPLTPNFTGQYLGGLISDHNIVPEMMPAKGEPCGGLVLFAIALDPELERARGKVRNLRYIRTLLAAHADHLGQMLRDYGDETTPVIVQAEKASILRALRASGFVVAGKKGGDGDLLLTSDLKSLLSRFKPSHTTLGHLKAA